LEWGFGMGGRGESELVEKNNIVVIAAIID